MLLREAMAARFPQLEHVVGVTGYLAATLQQLPLAVTVDIPWQVSAYIGPARSELRQKHGCKYEFGVCRLKQYSEYGRRLETVVKPWLSDRLWQSQSELRIVGITPTCVRLELTSNNRELERHTVACPGLPHSRAQQAAFSHAVQRDIHVRLEQVRSNSPFMLLPFAQHRIDTTNLFARWYILYQVGETSCAPGNLIEMCLEVWEKGSMGGASTAAISMEAINISQEKLYWERKKEPLSLHTFAAEQHLEQRLSVDQPQLQLRSA